MSETSPRQGWKIGILRDFCSDERGAIQTGPFGSQLHASDYRDTGIPVVNPTHLLVNGIDESSVPRIDKELADTLSRHYLREGDILMSRRGDFSRYAYINPRHEGWMCGTGCLLIRLCHPDVDNRFVAASLSLETTQAYLKQSAVGSIMPNLNTRILGDVPVWLPPRKEQAAIVETLDAIREAKAVGTVELRLERERKAALIEHLFTHGTRGETTKQSEIGEIPQSWEAKPLSLISTIRYGLGQPPQLDPQGVPMIRATDIKRGRIVQSGILRVKREAIPEARNPFLSKGDIIVVRSGAYTGDVAQYDGRWEYQKKYNLRYRVFLRIYPDKEILFLIQDYI